MAFRSNVELLRVCILFKAVHYSFTINSHRVFTQTRVTRPIFVLHRLAVGIATSMAFRSDRSYFACVFYLKLYTSACFYFTSVSPDKDYFDGFDTFPFRY